MSKQIVFLFLLFFVNINYSYAVKCNEFLASIPQNSVLRGVYDMLPLLGEFAKKPVIMGPFSSNKMVLIEILFSKIKISKSGDFINFSLTLLEKVGARRDQPDVYGASHFSIALAIKTRIPVNSALGDSIIKESDEIGFEKGPVFVGSSADIGVTNALEYASQQTSLKFNKGQKVFFKSTDDIQVEGLNRLIGLKDTKTSRVELVLASALSKIDEDFIEINRHLTLRINSNLSQKKIAEFWKVFIERLYPSLKE